MSQYVLNTPLIVNSTTSGIVVPRLTTAQKIAASATAGMVVFDTDIQDFEFYNGYTWVGTGYSYTGPLFSSNLVDGFGRVRVSNPFTLFDSSNHYRNNEKFSYYITGSATGYFDAPHSTQLLQLTGSNGHIIAESKRVMSYQPGKSLLSYITFRMNTGANGLTQRAGYFNTTNGIFFQSTGSGYEICKEDNGSIVGIPQSSWNQDQLNGSGPSGVTLDFTKAQIMYICLEWLGVGTVEVGFVVNQQFIPAHKFWGANSYTTTYMQTANLPVRYEIYNDGVSDNNATLTQICSTVISEGGYTDTSLKRYFNMYDLPSGNTKTSTTSWLPLFSISLNSAYPNAIVVPSQIDLFLTTNGTIQYKLVLNGTLSGESWTGAGSDSSVIVDYSATSITFGSESKIIDMNFTTSSNQSKSILTTDTGDFNYQLGRSVSGLNSYTFDILTVCILSVSGGPNVTGDIGWYEIGML